MTRSRAAAAATCGSNLAARRLLQPAVLRRSRLLVLFRRASGGGFETEPLVEYSTELHVQGAKPQSFARQLRAGTYLVEVRERDIDLRVKVDAGDLHIELADAYLRHGFHRTVVSLPAAQTVRITLTSVDQRDWRGTGRGAHPAVARKPPPMRPPTNACSDSWRSARAMSSSRARIPRVLARGGALAACRRGVISQAASDMRSLAETEYQQGYVEFNLLFEFEDGPPQRGARAGAFRGRGR